MLWIYLPPIVLIAALVALVVILGKKTAALKKKGAFRDDEVRHEPEKSSQSRVQNIWKIVLRLAEGTINMTKTGMKKMEEGLSGILHRMKEKRLGKNIPKPEDTKKEPKIDYYSEDIIITKIEEKEPGGEKEEHFWMTRKLFSMRL